MVAISWAHACCKAESFFKKKKGGCDVSNGFVAGLGVSNDNEIAQNNV
jgi:hypothetical protein